MSNSWNFIMQASFSSDLYGKGKERILVNRQTKGLEYYYTTDGKITICEGAMHEHR
jgi:hypothetical protein